MQKIIKVDVDGVLRNLLPKMCELYNDYYNENVTPEDIKNFDLKDSFNKCEDPIEWFFQKNGSYVYLNSTLFFNAKEAMDILHKKGYYIIIVSNQPTHKQIENTLEWLKENEIYYDSICFTEKKHLILGDIIVDDNIDNLNNCHECEKILIDAPYNRIEGNYKRFNNLFEFVETL